MFRSIFIYFAKHCCGRNLALLSDDFFFNKQLLTAWQPATSEFKRAFLCQRLQMLSVSKSMFR